MAFIGQSQLSKRRIGSFGLIPFEKFWFGILRAGWWPVSLQFAVTEYLKDKHGSGLVF